MANEKVTLNRIALTIASITLKKFVDLTLLQPFNQHHSLNVHISLTDINEALGKSDNNSANLKDLSQQWFGEKITLLLQEGSADSSSNFKEEKKQSFTGVITSIQFQKHDAINTVVVISAMSATVLLHTDANTRSFTDKSLSAIINEVLKPFSGKIKSAVTPAFGESIPYITQYNEDDFHFIQRLAEIYGEWYYYDGNQLIFGKSSRSNSPAADLEYGSNLSHMEYAMRIVPFTNKGHYYDYFADTKYEAPGSAEKVNGLQDYAQVAQKKSDDFFSNETLDLSFQGFQKNADLKKAISLKKSEASNQLAVLKGTSDCIEVKLGGLVKVKDDIYENNKVVRTEEYGTFLVTTLNHYIDSTGHYQNDFEAIPQDTTFPPINYRIIAPKAECQPAKVKDVGDEKEMGRVKVQFYWQKDGDTTPWIRVANLMSSKEQGVYFVPEKDEIVFVDFEFGNPDLPFVRGSMYHGSEKPGSKLFQKENNLKGIITKGGNHIIIDDTSGKEEIRIYNKDKKNELIMSLDEPGFISLKSNGNIKLEAKDTIEMKAKNIKMTADQNWDVKAQNANIKTDMDTNVETQGGDVNIKSKMAINLESEMETGIKGKLGVKVEGLAVNLKADANIDIKANANISVQGAILSIAADGIAELKGAMVKIN